ncbi:hypothetical protein EDD86DRAFT_208626 [Gorgonomyces haynaldii]|nr:hypothetical protein EDD86DRAFT_208626 [Gorgonomyces haynaldii]
MVARKQGSSSPFMYPESDVVSLQSDYSTSLSTIKPAPMAFRMDLIHRFFEDINPRNNLLDKQSFVAGIETTSPFLLYCIYASVERISSGNHTNGPAATFFRLARNMVSSLLEEASFSNIVGLNLLATYAESNGDTHGLFYFEMAVRLFQILIKQSPQDTMELQPKDQATELNRRLWWMFMELDHHHSTMWNLPLRLPHKDVTFGVPTYCPVSSFNLLVFEDMQRPVFDPYLVNDMRPLPIVEVNRMMPPIPSFSIPNDFRFNSTISSAPSIATHYTKILQLYPKLAEFIIQERKSQLQVFKSERETLDRQFTQWFEGLPNWMQIIPNQYGSDMNRQMPPHWKVAHLLILYYDARMLLNKYPHADDVLYSGLDGSEPAYCKMVAIHSASMVAKISKRFLAYNHQFQYVPYKVWRSLTTAGLVLLSGYTQRCFINPSTLAYETGDQDLEEKTQYIKGLVTLLVQALDSLGKTWVMASWDADKLRKAMDVAFDKQIKQ